MEFIAKYFLAWKMTFCEKILLKRMKLSVIAECMRTVIVHNVWTYPLNEIEVSINNKLFF